MTLSLQTIQDLAWGPERSTIEITLTSGETATLEQGDKPRPLADDWAWLQRALELGKPIAVTAARDNALPSTVVLSVEVNAPEGSQTAQVFGPPRPGLMQLDLGTPTGPKLLSLLQEAQTSQSAVALALREGVMIEDAQILSQDDATRLLGFASQ